MHCCWRHGPERCRCGWNDTVAKRTLTRLNGASYPATRVTTPLFFHVCQILLNFSGVREQIPVVKAAHSHLKVAVFRLACWLTLSCAFRATVV